MGVGHGHGHGQGAAQGHAGGRHRWRLGLSFGLVGSFFGVELVTGLWSGSLALLSDAGHMAADVVALGAALAATRIATMKDRTGRKTFGSYRAEVFASGLTVLLMLGAGAYVAIEGLRRIGQSVELESGAVMVVGTIGLLINIAALMLLRGGAGESLNVKGAYLEVVADTVGSVGVIAAGLMVALTGSVWWDTGIALAIAAFVVVRAVMLGREVLTVLGQHAPAGMDPAEVEATLIGVDGVDEVHDLHLWTLTSGMNVATAHLVAAPGSSPAVLVAAQAALRDRYGVEHATLQVESDATACTELSW
ncbi:cation diffusion facilitator family transporter [Nocardioides sp. TRM66260-LWL]|uniref:cation diffusion facilitator family transporter n=1 Tax=Nocardioides sp. TRM66260-LWL TaxID=2874478 RepID=UPI001CC5397C|nr:cation diffusion facilitator family transporter [Nocardioides sp. TRM66260-LWL]MBZ5733521.1 cation diffusion facilitator family transporter [Nocardioides sp. TRM66260-LWL]